MSVLRASHILYALLGVLGVQIGFAVSPIPCVNDGEINNVVVEACNGALRRAANDVNASRVMAPTAIAGPWCGEVMSCLLGVGRIGSVVRYQGLLMSLLVGIQACIRDCTQWGDRLTRAQSVGLDPALRFLCHHYGGARYGQETNIACSLMYPIAGNTSGDGLGALWPLTIPVPSQSGIHIGLCAGSGLPTQDISRQFFTVGEPCHNALMQVREESMPGPDGVVPDILRAVFTSDNKWLLRASRRNCRLGAEGLRRYNGARFHPLIDYQGTWSGVSLRCQAGGREQFRLVCVDTQQELERHFGPNSVYRSFLVPEIGVGRFAVLDHENFRWFELLPAGTQSRSSNVTGISLVGRNMHPVEECSFANENLRDQFVRPEGNCHRLLTLIDSMMSATGFGGTQHRLFRIQNGVLGAEFPVPCDAYCGESCRTPQETIRSLELLTIAPPMFAARCENSADELSSVASLFYKHDSLETRLSSGSFGLPSTVLRCLNQIVTAVRSASAGTEWCAVVQQQIFLGDCGSVLRQIINDRGDAFYPLNSCAENAIVPRVDSMPCEDLTPSLPGTPRARDQVGSIDIDAGPLGHINLGEVLCRNRQAGFIPAPIPRGARGVHCSPFGVPARSLCSMAVLAVRFGESLCQISQERCNL